MEYIYHRKQSKHAVQGGEIQNNGILYSKRQEQGSVMDGAQTPSLAGQPLPTSSCRLKSNETKDQTEVGCIYEIIHEKLPPRTPVQLRSIRAVMVGEKTESNISVRFPSFQSRQSYFTKGIREMYPELDEKFVMGTKLAEKMLNQKVLSQEFVQKHVEEELTKLRKEMDMVSNPSGISQELDLYASLVPLNSELDSSLVKLEKYQEQPKAVVPYLKRIEDESVLIWFSGKDEKCLSLIQLSRTIAGECNLIFQRYPRPKEYQSSLIYNDRSLDLNGKDKDEAEVWFSSLKEPISHGDQRKWRTESRSDGIPSEATSPRTYTRSSPLHSPSGSGDCLQDESVLLWFSGKEEKHLSLIQLSRIIAGQPTLIFKRYPRPEEYQSSLIYNDRSMHLICKDKDEAEVWFSGLKELILRGDQQKQRTESRNDGIPFEATSPRTYTRSSPLHSHYWSGDCLQDESVLIWFSGKEEKHLSLIQLSRTIAGQPTLIFKRYPRPEEYQSSLIYNDRSMHLICKDKDEAEVWFSGLKELILRGDQRKRSTESRSDGIPFEATSPRTYTRSSPLHSHYWSGNCLQDESVLIWFSGKEEKHLGLIHLSRTIAGQPTLIFKRYPRPEEYQSSLIYNDRSMHLICKDKDEAEVWFSGLKELILRGDQWKRSTESRSDGIPFEATSPRTYTRSSPLHSYYWSDDCLQDEAVLTWFSGKEEKHLSVIHLSRTIAGQPTVFSTPDWEGNMGTKRMRVEVADLYLVSKAARFESLEVFNPRSGLTTLLRPHSPLRNYKIIGYRVDGWLLFRNGQNLVFVNVLTEEYVPIPHLRWRVDVSARATFTGSPTNRRTTIVILDIEAQWAVVSVYNQQNGWRLFMIEGDFISGVVDSLIVFRDRFYWFTDNQVFCCSGWRLEWILDIHHLLGVDIADSASFVVHEGQRLLLVIFEDIDEVRIFYIVDRGNMGDVFEEMVGHLRGLIYIVGSTGGEMVTSDTLKIFAADAEFEGFDCIYFDMENPRGLKLCSRPPCRCTFAWVRFGQDQLCRVNNIDD